MNYNRSIGNMIMNWLVYITMMQLAQMTSRFFQTCTCVLLTQQYAGLWRYIMTGTFKPNKCKRDNTLYHIIYYVNYTTSCMYCWINKSNFSACLNQTKQREKKSKQQSIHHSMSKLSCTLNNMNAL